MAAPDRNQRVVHQDYIVRQRYVNTLPAPPGAPKLLDLPTDALNQYTSPVYASRMARNQPLNIEADAFLGMPIDLVGMPGVFEGDESAIQAPMVTPQVHPKDKSLLRPLKSLGKPKAEEAEISFLRRTQYTAEDRSRADAARVSVTPNVRKRRLDANKADPLQIKRAVIKGFDIANPATAYKGPDSDFEMRGAPPSSAELEAWNAPKHPTNPNLKPLDFYPVLPDLDTQPDEGNFTLIQLKGQPTNVTSHYDVRMDAALLRPDFENVPDLSEELLAKQAAHKADPIHNEAPFLPYNYAFFIPENDETALNFQRKFDPHNVERHDPSLYTARDGEAEGENNCFRYQYVRDYESAHLADNRDDPYQEVALVLHDGDADKGVQKGAYVYGITHKLQLKARRNVNIQQMGMTTRFEESEGRIDQVHVTVREPNAEEREMRAENRRRVEPAEDGMDI